MHDYAEDELPRLLSALLPERKYLLVGVYSDGGSIALIHGAAGCRELGWHHHRGRARLCR